MRSTDRGESWEIISPDLSTKNAELIAGPRPAMGERGGAENHATLITVVESPVVAGVDLGGDGRWQCAGDARRGQDVDERPAQHRTHDGARGHVGQPG